MKTIDVAAVQNALADISGVGINIRLLTPALKAGDGPITGMIAQDTEAYRNAFFANAKLWHVIKQIICDLFMDDLIKGKIKIHHRGADVIIASPEVVADDRKYVKFLESRIRMAVESKHNSREYLLTVLEELLNDIHRRSTRIG